MSWAFHLPSEKLPEGRGWREASLTVVGTLALALLVNAGAVSYLDWRPVNLGYRVIKVKWQLLAAQTRPADWLVLGDSTGNQGVVPEVLSRTLGGPTLNLCTIGALGAWNDAWMLEAYSRRVGPPRHVLVLHTYQVWTRPLNLEAVAQIPPSLLDRGSLDPPLSLGVGDEVTLFLHRYVPLYAQDQALSRLVRTPWRVIGWHFDIDASGFSHQFRPSPEAVKRDAAEHLEFVNTAPFAMSTLNREALESLNALAERNGIEVFLASGPVYDGLWAHSAYRAYFNSVEAELRRFAGVHTHIHVVEGEPLSFPAETMQNADHLVESAARRFTAVLAARIAAQSGPESRSIAP